MAENDTSGRQMDSQEAQRRADEIARRYGLKTEESDVNTLANKRPEDQARYLADLEAQSQKRAAPTSNRTSDSQSGAYSTYADPRTEPNTTGSGAPTSYPTAGSGIAQWLGQAPDYSAALNQQNTLISSYMQQAQQQAAQIAADAKARQDAAAAAEAERKGKADALYAQLQGRATQALNISPEDAIIKGQVDAYRAEQERARRNLQSDAAETGRFLTPTQQAMSFERVGQAAGSLQAELMARELGSRRAEISDALTSMGGLLGADQVADLQRELHGLDNAIQQQQVGISGQQLGLQRELGLGRLGLDTEMGRGGLALQGELGRGGLSNDLLRTLLQNQQFYGDLGLKGQTQNDYYDLVRRGRLGNAI